MSQAKPGETVKLASGEGIFVDYETGFEVVNTQEVSLGEVIGERTNLALKSGGLLIVTEKKSSKKAKAETTEPEE